MTRRLFKLFRNIFRKSLKLFPRPIRFEIYRFMVSLDYRGLREFKFKLAESKSELEQAFKILHDEYVREGFMEPHPSKMRITPFHALPSTTTLVAKKGDDVVATVSLVRDAGFGLPVDSVYNLDEFRKYGGRIVEVSSLAVAKKYQHSGGAVLFPLLKYMYTYCREYFGAEYLVFAVNPKKIEFYESIILAKRLNQKVVDKYDFANGAPAVGAYVVVRAVATNYSAYYNRKPQKKNLYRFFIETDSPAFIYPERRVFSINDPVMTPDLLSYFFNEQSSVFKNLTEGQKIILYNFYKDPIYADVLPKMEEKLMEQTAKIAPRFDVELAGRIVFSQSRVVNLQVKNVSRSGILARLYREIRFGEKLKIQIAVADFTIVELEGWPVWMSDEKVYGFELGAVSEIWLNFIAELDGQISMKPPYKAISA